MIADSASLFSENSQTVSFVHHDCCVVFVLQAYYFRQIGQISFHRENTVDNNQFYRVGITFLELFFQIRHVVVLVFQLLGKGETPAVYNGSMVAIVRSEERRVGKECRYRWS